MTVDPRRTLKKILGGSSAFCFYCGVDSKPLIVFFLCTMGLLVLGSVMVMVWSVARGQWSDSEKVKFKVLEAESDDDESR
jgi:nitrogen fixation-related uncharacterized protein